MLQQQWSRLNGVQVQLDLQSSRNALTLGQVGNDDVYFATGGPAGLYVEDWYNVLRTGVTDEADQLLEPA